MLPTSLCLLILLLTYCVQAQGQPTDKAAVSAMQRVKTLPISSLDHDLPKVTLEFFLKYEGAGSPIKWEVNDCGNTLDIAGRERESTMCVQADIGLKDGRAARVIVSVGKAKNGAVSDPTICGVSVTYPGGMIHRLDHLRDLPVELHRPLPKGPKDLPSGVSA
jgi:hypothetical protein